MQELQDTDVLFTLKTEETQRTQITHKASSLDIRYSYHVVFNLALRLSASPNPGAFIP